MSIKGISLFSQFSNSSASSSCPSPAKSDNISSQRMTDVFASPPPIVRKRGIELLLGKSPLPTEISEQDGKRRRVERSAQAALFTTKPVKGEHEDDGDAAMAHAPATNSSSSSSLLTSDHLSSSSVLILPDLSAFSNSSSSSSAPATPEPSSPLKSTSSSPAQHPPTPPSKAKTRISPYVRNLLDIHDRCEVSYKGKKYPIRDLQKKGHFKSAFAIDTGTPILSTCSNESLLVTVIKKPYLETKAQQTIQRNLATATRHYNELSAEKFPIAQVYNADTIVNDGFFLVEKVTPFKGKWTVSEKLEELLKDSTNRLPEHYDLVKRSFARQSNIPNDLQNNLGVNAKGELVLFDFMETSEGNQTHAFRMIARDQITQLARGNPEVYQYLISSVLESGIPDAEKIYLDLGGDPKKVKQEAMTSS